MMDANAENAKTLAALMGLDEAEAAELLDIDVLVQNDKSTVAAAVAEHLVRLLKRTVRSVGHVTAPAVAVVVGDCPVALDCPIVRILHDGQMIQIGMKAAGRSVTQLSSAGSLVLACYAAGAAIRLACSPNFPLSYKDPILIDPASLETPDIVDMGEVFLAGAGAIGNGFVYALAEMNPTGILHVVDPKRVTPGNLNRCMLFEADDTNRSKAAVLVERARPLLPNVKLHAHGTELAKLAPGRKPNWLRRLVVGVDSRRVRRHLQEELPREVYDASTTGMEEVVLHFNERLEPSCLSCLYHESEDEDAHERHVADTLGVSLAQVKAQLIDATSAGQIARRHPQVAAADLIGRAFDSIFKALCGSGSLTAADSRTVLAPLSFVSVLAGAWLAIEFGRRICARDAKGAFTSWRLSPWASPLPSLKLTSDRRSDCCCCGDATIRETVGMIWG